jgi:hypothetical protein
MSEADEKAGEAPEAEAVSWLEAALQAGLGAGQGPRPDLARRALEEAAPAAADKPLEAWLEAVAVELGAGAVLVPDDMVEAIAARIIADRGRSIGAHGRLQGDTVRDLLPRP